MDIRSELRRPTGPAALLQIPDVGGGHRYVHRQPLRRTIIRYYNSFQPERIAVRIIEAEVQRARSQIPR